MFTSNSRYNNLPQLQYRTEEGDIINYVSRRILPPLQQLKIIKQFMLIEGDRPDLIAYRHLGDPLVYWQIADANGVMHPRQLIAKPGQLLVVALPQGM